jgi:hypothetical protein
MMIAKTMHSLLILSLFWILNSPRASAQLTTTGTVNGTVTDPAGAVVPQAAVTVVSEDTNLETHTETNRDGSFVVSALQTGHYSVKVVKEGFETYTETGIVLDATRVVTVNVVLHVGQVATNITVHESAVQIETTTAEVSNQVSQEQVGTLPLNGRNYQSLSFLMPGVTSTTPDTQQGQGGYLTQNTISVNGMGISGTMYYLDGVWNMNSGSYLQTTITPNPDTLREVKLLQNDFGSQYTLNGSNVLLLETKSGTDTFHGSAYEYLRNNIFDGRNYFSPTVGALHQDIFGYTIGGPFIIPKLYNPQKDKTYFFWSEQWVIQHVGNTILAADATAAQRAGTFTTAIKDPTTGMPFPQTSPGVYQIPTNRINTGALALLNAIAPLPNDGTGFDNYLNTTPTLNNQRDDEIKVDQDIGSKLKLMGEYLDVQQTNNNSTQTQGKVPFSTTTQPTTTFSQIAQVRLTQLLSSSMVNTTSVSMDNTLYNLNVSGLVYQSQVPGLTENLPYPITPREGGPSDRLPFIEFAGGYPTMGVVYILPVSHASTLEDSVSDDWSWLRGNHYLQAGMQYVRGHERVPAFAPTAGIFVFSGYATGNPLADYLLGYAAQLQQQNNEFHGYQFYPIASPYFQDEWKIKRQLTLTLGLRYLYLPNTSYDGSQSGLYSNFVPSLYNASQAPIINNNGTITTTPNYNPLNGIVILGKNAPLNYTSGNKNYFNPTVGFAYSPFSNGKTSLRGGYGITHIQTLPGSCSQNCLNNPPSIMTEALIDPGFPNATGGTAAPATAPTLTIESTNLSSPIIQTYSLGVQQQFGGWFVSITGAGDVVTHLSLVNDINQPVPEGGYNFNPIINTGTVSRYASSLAGPAPYQGFGALNSYQSLAYSNWDALEVNVKHPVGHNLFFSTAYTWQHGLSNNRGIKGIEGNAGVQDIYNPSLSYGTTNDNVAQLLAISGIYQIPLFENSGGWTKALLGGWRYSDVTTIQSGFALDPGLSTSTPGLATRPNKVAGTSIAGPKTVKEWFNTAAFVAPPAGFFGNAAPGSITGPGVVDFDMALYKDFKINERNGFEFRSEFFNIFNHTNFSGVSASLGAGSFGQVTSALDPRIMEFALRYEF